MRPVNAGYLAQLRGVLGGASLALLAPASVGATAEATSALRIEDVSHYFTRGALEAGFRKALSKSVIDRLAHDHLALWVMATPVTLGNGTNYCWAEIGVTEPTTQEKRSARMPGITFPGFWRSGVRGQMSDESLTLCVGNAVNRAMAKIGEQPLDIILVDLESAREDGVRKAEPASPQARALFSGRVSEDARAEILESIPAEFAQAFDYRRLEWVVHAATTRLGDQVVCFAFAGVSTRPPDGRNPHFPSRIQITANELTPEQSREDGIEQKCRNAEAFIAIKTALKIRWDDSELLKDLSWTRERGIQQVSNYRRQETKAVGAGAAPRE
jgi:hypothetical protein